jgi:hypothetical protein
LALAISAQALLATGDFAGLVDFGDHRKIYLECSGRRYDETTFSEKEKALRDDIRSRGDFL